MKIIASFLIATSITSFAAANSQIDCYRKALKNFTVDSSAFQFSNDEISEEFFLDPESASREAIFHLEEMLECQKYDFDITDIFCKELSEGNDDSKMCYAEAKYGYFFLSKDMMENLNIIFVRSHDKKHRELFINQN